MAGQKVTSYHWADRVNLYFFLGICPDSTVFYVHDGVEWIENWEINISIESYDEGTVKYKLSTVDFISPSFKTAQVYCIFILTCNEARNYRSLLK